MNNDDYQKYFLNYVFDNKGKKSTSLLDEIIPIGHLEASEVMSIYSDDYQVRLREVLKQTFEGVWFVLGDDVFYRVCRDYVFENYSSLYSLDLYGESFPDFLGEDEECSELFPELKDLAFFDWSFWRAFHSEEVQFKDFFINIEEEDLLISSLRFVPNTTVFSWELRLFELWKKRQDSEQGELGLDQLDLQQRQQGILFKSFGEVQFHQMELPQVSFFRELLKGRTIGEVLHAEIIRSPEEVTNLFQFLRTSGVVAGMIKSRV